MTNLYNLHPTIHYVRYSIGKIDSYSFYLLSEDLSKIYGKYDLKIKLDKKGQKIHLNHYKEYGIILSHPRVDNDMTAMLTFPATIPLVPLVGILKKYHKFIISTLRYNQNIFSIEVKFDFRLINRGLKEHKKLQNFLLRYLFPRFPRKPFFHLYKDKCKLKGNVLLGDETNYFYSCGKDELGNMGKPNRSKKGSFFKSYMRNDGYIGEGLTKYNRESVGKISYYTTVDNRYIAVDEYSWLMRFEVICKRNQLKTLLKNFGGLHFESPYDLPRIIDQIRNTKFSDYFEFCTINLDGFTNHVNKLLTKKKVMPLILGAYLDKLYDKENKMVDVYRNMKKLSRLLDLNYLYSIVKKYRIVKGYKELQKQVKKRFGIDLSTDLTYLS